MGSSSLTNETTPMRRAAIAAELLVLAQPFVAPMRHCDETKKATSIGGVGNQQR
jgi:hypothetical protein